MRHAKKRYAKEEKCFIVDCYSSFRGYLVSFLNRRKGILRAEDNGIYWNCPEFAQVKCYTEEDSEWTEETLEHLLWKTNFGRNYTYIGVVEEK